MIRFSRFLTVALAALLAFATVPAEAQDSSPSPDGGPTNVILLIPDGFGPASATMARDYLRKYRGVETLALDSLQRGAVRTFSSDSRVTDSAAGATAYATGHKTYNGAIAVDTLKQPIATILQAAERRGMSTGLVATSRITHATPASFSAHVKNRWMENEIASQQITRDIDVILGGGRRHFLPQSADGSKRKDDRNLVEEAQNDGYQFVDTRDALMAIDKGPVLGLFSMSHMSYEIDRDPTVQPSLAEMTQKAIDLVSQNENGYFLMVEGSRIDHAGHSNDAAAHLHDILAYDEAVATALKAARADGNTLVISVSDHETGGLSLGRDIEGEGVYAWHPEVLHAVSASHGVIRDSIKAARAALPGDATPADSARVAADAFKHFTGIDDLSSDEMNALKKRGYALNFVLSDVIERRAVIGWTTRGHTAVDVSLHAYGPGAEHFTGNIDNTRVGQLLSSLLGFDLDDLTADIRNNGDDTSASTTGSR